MDWDTMIMYYEYYDECIFEGKNQKIFGIGIMKENNSPSYFSLC